jgi:hypothetical protein
VESDPEIPKKYEQKDKNFYSSALSALLSVKVLHKKQHFQTASAVSFREFAFFVAINATEIFCHFRRSSPCCSFRAPHSAFRILVAAEGCTKPSAFNQPIITRHRPPNGQPPALPTKGKRMFIPQRLNQRRQK